MQLVLLAASRVESRKVALERAFPLGRSRPPLKSFNHYSFVLIYLSNFAPVRFQRSPSLFFLAHSFSFSFALSLFFVRHLWPAILCFTIVLINAPAKVLSLSAFVGANQENLLVSVRQTSSFSALSQKVREEKSLLKAIGFAPARSRLIKLSG